MDGEDITFDKQFQIRVLEEEKHEEARKLQDQCREFLTKTQEFTKIVNSFMDLIDTKATLIEREKLRAIGLRNQVESEKDVRKRKQRELSRQIEEKQAELERYEKQFESILKVEQEQKLLLEKLSNNEL